MGAKHPHFLSQFLSNSTTIGYHCASLLLWRVLGGRILCSEGQTTWTTCASMDSLKSWKWEDGLVQTSRNFKEILRYQKQFGNDWCYHHYQTARNRMISNLVHFMRSTGNHKVVAIIRWWLRKTNWGWHRTWWAKCNEQRCQSANFGSLLRAKTSTSRKSEDTRQTEQTKLQMSFRYVEKVWKKFEYLSFFPNKTTYSSLENNGISAKSLHLRSRWLWNWKNMAASPLKGRVPAILVVGPGEKQR